MRHVEALKMKGPVPLSVLDFGHLSAGQTSSDAMADTTALAQRADELGYHRFWVSEHHAIPWLASTSPPVLIASLAAKTLRIRLGSGGVMLSNHAPLVVSEQFALLEALHPGRIDLGLGRAPGADPETAAALGRTPAGLSGDRFAHQLHDVLAMLGPDGAGGTGTLPPRGVVSPTPVAASAPPVWLLGTSRYSAELAGSRGLPYCFAAHNGVPAEMVTAVLDVYRGSFRATQRRAVPHAMVSVSVLAAETDAEVERLGRPGRLQRYAERSGWPIRPFLSPEDAAEVNLGPLDEQAMAAMPYGGVAATPDRAVAVLEDFAASTGADELLVCSFVHGAATRIRTLELLADAWGQRGRTTRHSITA